MITQATKRKALNAALQGYGFAGLDSPRLLLDQIASLIDDHERFRALLLKVEPHQRTDAYEALKPRLRFTAKPLDDYVSEGRIRASEAISHSETASLEDIATEAIRRRESRGSLLMVCAKCLSQEVFVGSDQTDCVRQARNKGWVCDDADGEAREICPHCPAIREK
jgi:hypothetical protein